MLSIKDVHKSYDGKEEVLKGVSLEVEAGDIFAFIGHNGAGKTTLIKCIVGLLSFEKGEIDVDGINVKESPKEAKKKLAYIPDNPEVYESLTGLQFLNFIADAFDVGESVRKDRITRYAEAFQMTEHLNTLVKSYSHGMKQKIVLMSALIHEPKILIMDEPFVGLDPEAAYTIKGIMKEMADNGCAIFFSTHVLEVAEKLCNKVAVINHGEIVKIGTMAEVKQDESLEEVFMNLIEEEKNHA